ncbi:MAG: hypothetical protein GF401_07210 [Chitinivibrionales bacterium]|nr:hypothetical protein [Chitinivibrionales bacterium]
MQIQSYSKYDYQVLRIPEDLTTETDLSEIQQIIEEYPSLKNVALWFTQNSCLYTESIFILTHCYRLLAERGGELALIKPNAIILSALQTVGLTHLISVYNSEEELRKED